MKHTILLQVAAPAIVTGVVLVVTGVGSAWAIHRLQANLGAILAENVASVQVERRLEHDTRQLRYHTLIYLIRPTPEGLRQIQQDERSFQTAFDLAERAANQPDEIELLRKVGTGFVRYREEMARLRSEGARTGEGVDLAHLVARHPIRHITAPCQELEQLELAQLERTAAESNTLSSRSRILLLILGLAGPLGGLVAGYGITRGLTRSLTRLHIRTHDVVSRLQGDDTEIQLLVTANGDLDVMNRQLEEILHRTEEMVQRLQRQQQEMLRAEQLRLLGQLASSVAHEVRNPLTGMKLLVEAALRPIRPQRLSKEDLEVIHGEIARLEGIVQHFLDFARPQPLIRRIADLREVVARPVELVRARAGQQGVNLVVVMPRDPLEVDMDGIQLGTVLLNLLLNALDALPRGGQVTIEAQKGEPDVIPQRSMVQLEVRDDGPGIAADLLPRLFTPFVSGKPTGTGLGLSLARRIIEEHGGKIEAGNQPAGGARFRILLPQAVDAVRVTREASCPGCC